MQVIKIKNESLYFGQIYEQLQFRLLNFVPFGTVAICWAALLSVSIYPQLPFFRYLF